MHPNALVHKVQLERARQKYIVRGELGDGKEDAVALGAPEEQEKGVEKHGVDLKSTNGEVMRSEDQRIEGNAEQKQDSEGIAKAEKGSD